ncbi:DUF2510 domain-containing protein [Streptomyces sp. XY006]|uniref:DUF2510 domain-containing protein n=1 Tax=Streptomyces sp. XY006 TaxID=2021410 RepID=UPI001C5310C5|nr:DUF2510 domain-containing protein [Streptomyces sp. XY006]
MSHTDNENIEGPGPSHEDRTTKAAPASSGRRMARKKVWITYPDEAQLGRSRDDDGAQSPNLYVPGSKGVKGQVKIYDVNEPSIVTQIATDVLSHVIERAVDRAIDEVRLHAKSWWNDRKSKRKSAAPSKSRVRGLFEPAPAAPAGWYVDRFDATQLRYWDGVAWTNRFAPTRRTAATPAPVATTSHAPATQPLEESRIIMSSAEWQELVLAWLKAGAIGEELWRRISTACIKDADAATLESQREMEKLTARQGADRIRLMLESNSSLRDEGALAEFMKLFGSGRNADFEDARLRNAAMKEAPRLTEGEL